MSSSDDLQFLDPAEGLVDALELRDRLTVAVADDPIAIAVVNCARDRDLVGPDTDIECSLRAHHLPHGLMPRERMSVT